MISQMTPAGVSPASRARSTDASVCPPARGPRRLWPCSGKTWPGWTRSCGVEPGSIATWIVWARSWAEMPVVTPSLASTATVNAVCSGSLVLGRHQVEAERVAAFGGQRQADQAAALFRHEIDRLRGGELGRHRQVALVLAVLVVADDDHPPAADLLDRLLDRRERALPRLGLRLLCCSAPRSYAHACSFRAPW